MKPVLTIICLVKIILICGILIQQSDKTFNTEPYFYEGASATGIAAAQSIKTGQPANDLNTKQLITSFGENDAHLPQKELSKEMTRA